MDFCHCRGRTCAVFRTRKLGCYHLCGSDDSTTKGFQAIQNKGLVCAAFLCLLLSPLPSMSTFGIFAALVIAVNYALCMTMTCGAVMVNVCGCLCACELVYVHMLACLCLWSNFCACVHAECFCVYLPMCVRKWIASHYVCVLRSNCWSESFFGSATTSVGQYWAFTCHLVVLLLSSSQRCVWQW